MPFPRASAAAPIQQQQEKQQKPERKADEQRTTQAPSGPSRTTGVKIKEPAPESRVVVVVPSPTVTYAPTSAKAEADASNGPAAAPSEKGSSDDNGGDEKKRGEEEAAKKKAAEEEAAKKLADAEAARKREEEERLAGQAALERERAAAAAAAEEKAHAEMERRLAEEKKAADERVAAETKAREDAERKAKEERDRLEADAKAREDAARADKDAAERKAADEAKARADAEAKIEAERKAREDAERKALEDKQALEAAASAREAVLEREKQQAAELLAKAERQKQREAEIVASAREMNFRDPAAAVSLVPDGAKDVRAALADAARKDVSLVRVVTKTTGTVCDPEFVGKALVFDFPDEVTTFGVLLNYIRVNTGVNFMPDGDVEEMPVKVNVSNVPWTTVFKNLLDYKDLEMNCSGGVIQIAQRAKLAAIQENRRRTAPLVEEYIPLRYLQVTPQVTVDVAGRANNPTGSAYKTLEDTINRLLKDSGNQQAQVARVPNRNELFVRAPADTMSSIKRLIERADRESYVVVIRASTYSADDSKLRDIGLQSALTISDAAGLNLGGFSTLPRTNLAGSGGSGSTGSGTNQPAVGLQPGKVPGLPDGFAVPSSGLSAVSPAAVLGGTGLFGTVQFALQLSALQQRGIVNVQQRPALLVNNGDTGVLDFGRTIAVAVQALGTGNVATGQLELLNAGSTLSVTPSVAEDDKGEPAFVTLDVRLEANDVDTSVQTSVAPSIVRRAIQTRYVMGNRQTVVFSAFSTDSTTRQRTKTPFLGDVPGVGNLFKRNLDQVSRARTYFTLSVEIVRQSQIINVATPPADSSPTPVPPPSPQRPSPFKSGGGKEQ
jgi:hypothetical protein